MEEFAHDFASISASSAIELVSLDGRDGASMASLFDIVRYPAIVVQAENGSVLKMWQGDEEVPPSRNELLGYSNS